MPQNTNNYDITQPHGPRSSQSKGKLKKSVKIAGIIIGCYLTVAVVALAIYFAYASNTSSTVQDITFTTTSNPTLQRNSTSSMFPSDNGHVKTSSSHASDNGSLLRPAARTNFILVGLDNNSLADAIMVGSFHRDTGNVRLMSIPRDTYTHIPQRRLDEMYAHGLKPPAELKINAVRAFGGRTHGMPYLKAQLGEMLGVKFDYYLEADLTAFSQIVDAIGGVTMYIPRALNYSDPCQGLYINIPEGLQHLDGHRAEGLVRFRSFPTGDLMRNNMQMEFMSELIKQALTRDAVTNDPLGLANIIFNQVRTNVGIFEATKYLPYIRKIGAENVQTFTLPGTPEYRNGVSWFIPNTAELPATVGEVFYSF